MIEQIQAKLNVLEGRKEELDRKAFYWPVKNEAYIRGEEVDNFILFLKGLVKNESI